MKTFFAGVFVGIVFTLLAFSAIMEPITK